MPKPPNVQYVYPLFTKIETELPEGLKTEDLLVIVNIESQRPDDLLYDQSLFNKLRD